QLLEPLPIRQGVRGLRREDECLLYRFVGRAHLVDEAEGIGRRTEALAVLTARELQARASDRGARSLLDVVRFPEPLGDLRGEPLGLLGLATPDKDGGRVGEHGWNAGTGVLAAIERDRGNHLERP